MLRIFKYIPLISLLAPVLFILFSTMPVFAIAPANTTMIIDVYSYRNCIETGDQLYIAYFEVDYTTNPDESLGEAYMVRLLGESDEELGVFNILEPYYNNGYAKGVTSLYFSATDAPTWDGDYTVELVGNPTLSWTGSVPSDTFTGWDTVEDNPVNETQTLISGRIVSRETGGLARNLELDWTSATYDLLETTTVGTFLSDNGYEYFSAVIDNLSVVAPYALSYRDVDLDYDRTDEVYDYTHDYSDDLDDNISGGVFDVTDAADLFGTSRGALTAFVYYGVCFIAFTKLAPMVGSTKPLIALMIPISILGAFIGVPLIIVIVTTFIAFIALAYALFYKNSTA